MSVFFVSIDPASKPRDVYKAVTTYYSKVGVKSGYLSWFVRERDLQKRKLVKLGCGTGMDKANPIVVEVADATMKQLRRALPRA